MHASLKLVMFDLDGTLIETGTEICQAVNDTLTQAGCAPVSQQQVNGWIGMGTLELLIRALAWSTQTSDLEIRESDGLISARQRFEHNYVLRCGTCSRLYPRVREVLTQLKEQGVKLAVVTNKEMRFTDIVLASHQLTDLFDIVIGGDSVPVKKPDPAGIERCLSLFAMDAAQALFVGDSSIDAMAAKNAAVPVWLLPYGYNMDRPVGECNPDRVISDISALLEFDAWRQSALC